MNAHTYRKTHVCIHTNVCMYVHKHIHTYQNRHRWKLPGDLRTDTTTERYWVSVDQQWRWIFKTAKTPSTHTKHNESQWQEHGKRVLYIFWTRTDVSFTGWSLLPDQSVCLWAFSFFQNIMVFLIYSTIALYYMWSLDMSPFRNISVNTCCCARPL